MMLTRSDLAAPVVAHPKATECMTLRFTEPLAAEVERIAAGEHRSRASVVRRLLLRGLQAEGRLLK
jgi:hypothetical protein